MLHLINFNSFLKRLVWANVFISTALYYIVQYFFPSFPVYRIPFISSVVTAILVSALLSPFFFRWAWKVIRRWNCALFRDLSGTWSGTIWPSTGGTLAVRAVIRQSLLATEIDLHGETVKSITLAASPMIEAGQHKLYYVYRAEPKGLKWPQYSGTTKFVVRALPSDNGDCLALSGEYFTDRDTNGRIELRQTSSDPSVDVSFY